MTSSDNEAAMRFCSTSPSAVVLTVWPSGTGELAEVVKWIAKTKARIVHSCSVDIASRRAALLLVMALYEGEDWLVSNCWYDEQPLDSGPPSPPFAGVSCCALSHGLIGMRA
jgi:hypothetical protein